MYKACKTEQSAARQRLLEQHLLAEMQTKHFDEISISDLCDSMNIPRKAFYRYFSGKQGALHALIDHTLIDFDNQTMTAGHSRTVSRIQYLVLYFRFWKSQKPLLDAIEHSSLWECLMRYTADYALAALKQRTALQSDELRNEGTYITRFTVYGMISILQSWYRRGFPESEEYMASIISRHVEKSLVYWDIK